MTNTMRRAGTAVTDWLPCGQCGGLLYRKRFDRCDGVCPECGWHGRLTARWRVTQLLDPGTARPVPVAPTAIDPLGFHDLVSYPDRLAGARASTGMTDAVQVVEGRLHGHRVVVAVLDFRFLGGSLGSAAGEAVATAVDTALARRSPLLLVTASGGARMQEGVLSLMQMAKTANGMRAMDEAGLLTVTLVTDPTFGGVAASFATLSDVLIAEPGARMGFAGPRVIEQVIGERLPEGFQTAEFLLAHGHVDDVRPRAEQRSVLATLFAAARPVPTAAAPAGTPLWTEPELVPDQPVAERLRLARDSGRPTTLDHVAHWADEFVELHGDRLGADCPAVVGGLAVIGGRPVMVLGHQKGHTTAELVRRSFGMPSPAGYRKAARLMRLAGKLRVPLLALIDTPGAHPGLAAESGGQPAAIAECLRTLGGLPVPVVAVITGEGGSGGALAFGVADRILICENGFYSVISPEGCAAILWRDPSAVEAAATALGIDARSLLSLGVVDGVVPEPPGGAHRAPERASALLLSAVLGVLAELDGLTGPELVERREARFRRFGAVSPEVAR